MKEDALNYIRDPNIIEEYFPQQGTWGFWGRKAARTYLYSRYLEPEARNASSLGGRIGLGLGFRV